MVRTPFVIVAIYYKWQEQPKHQQLKQYSQKEVSGQDTDSKLNNHILLLLLQRTAKEYKFVTYNKRTFIHIYIHRKPYSKSIVIFEGLHKRSHVEINACVKNSHGSQQVELKSTSLRGLTKFVDHFFPFSFQKLL